MAYRFLPRRRCISQDVSVLTLPRMNAGDARTTHVPADHVGVRGACPAPPQGEASEEAPLTHLPPCQ
jgi:hypothetical protein